MTQRDPVAEVLALEVELARLRDARLAAEARGDTLARDAADYEQRQLDRHRQRLRAALSPAQDVELELARHAQSAL